MAHSETMKARLEDKMRLLSFNQCGKMRLLDLNPTLQFDGNEPLEKAAPQKESAVLIICC